MKTILTPSVRYPILDLLRGWFLIVITVDHLTRFPSVFDPLTGRGLLWVSAAEGFFFVSGMLIGLVRYRTYIASGFAVMARKTWLRAGKLYLASIILTLVFSAIAYWLLSHGITTVKGGLIYYSSVLQLVWQTLILNFSYGWTDFLNYYVAYLLMAPFVLWLIHKRLWWVVLSLSIFFWLVKGVIILPFHPEFAIWQLYFFGGVIVGAKYEWLLAAWRSLSVGAQRTVRISTIGVAGISIIASFVFTFGTPFAEHHAQSFASLLQTLHLPSAQQQLWFFSTVKENELFNTLLQRDRTGLLRPILFGVWLSALVFVVRRFWTPVNRWFGWLLIPLGANSLYVYILQGVIIFAVPFLPLPNTFLVNSLTVVSVIALVWLAVRKRFLFGIIPR